MITFSSSSSGLPSSIGGGSVASKAAPAIRLSANASASARWSTIGLLAVLTITAVGFAIDVIFLTRPVRIDTTAMRILRYFFEGCAELFYCRPDPRLSISGPYWNRKVQTLIDGVDLVDATDVALRLVEADDFQEQVRVAGRHLFPDRGVPWSSVVRRQCRIEVPFEAIALSGKIVGPKTYADDRPIQILIRVPRRPFQLCRDRRARARDDLHQPAGLGIRSDESLEEALLPDDGENQQAIEPVAPGLRHDQIREVKTEAHSVEVDRGRQRRGVVHPCQLQNLPRGENGRLEQTKLQEEAHQSVGRQGITQHGAPQIFELSLGL